MRYDKSVISGFSFDEAVDAAKSFLRDEGFGLLCEIDVTKTLREKIGAEFRPYRPATSSFRTSQARSPFRP